jgi:hypothetical protein
MKREVGTRAQQSEGKAKEDAKRQQDDLIYVPWCGVHRFNVRIAREQN